ncbi:DUF1846 domain-containing protein [Metamycoplasma equirhinis]|uniref:DUF1846 domain-containing protein n=1 Tax=Metamycoplasma equirhinis TaxID=92402 RepID=UPI00359429F1
MKEAFNNYKYLDLQSKNIEERIEQFDNKLYLEFGGKLLLDSHASRVLPGFDPSAKLNLLLKLREKIEILLVLSARDIEKNKLHADLGISYDQDILRLIDLYRSYNFLVKNVVITHYNEQANAKRFRDKLTKLGICVSCHYIIKNYPNDIDSIISENGFGKNDYIKTERELVVITAPGPGSGKLAVALSQIYHDSKHNIKSGYAKFETFPIWNLAPNHPINLAYEAATADLNDQNMIDPFHLKKYKKEATNYNRDIEAFPVLNSLFKRIYGDSPYSSPTDMGVNMAGFCIEDEEKAIIASKKEIIRRYFHAMVDLKKDIGTIKSVKKIEDILKKNNINYSLNEAITEAHLLSITTEMPAVTISLSDNYIVRGKTSDLLGPSSAALLNALKYLAKIPKEIDLLEPSVIKLVQDLKINYLHNQNPRLHMNETLIVLSASAEKNENAKKAMLSIPKLKNADAHSTVILSETDVEIFSRLGIFLTEDPKYEKNRFYHK